jgi:PAS domain S-box-containing protein
MREPGCGPSIEGSGNSLANTVEVIIAMTLPGSKEMSDTEAKAHLAAILEFSEDAIVSSTPDGVITRWNRRAEEIFGRSTDEALGKNLALVVPENLGEELQVLRAKILEGERVQRLETVWLREDAALELSFTFFGVAGHGGEVIAIDTIISIRRVKEGEEECTAAVEQLSRERDRLYRNEQRLHKVIDLLPQLIWSATPDGAIDNINAFFRQYAGLGDGSEFLGETERLIRLVVHPDDTEAVRAAWQQAVSTGDSYQYAGRIRRADGVYRWFMGRALPERDQDGQLVRWYGTASDIHDLKETQEKLLISEMKFEGLYNSNMVAIFFWDENGVVTEGNEAFCDLLGIDRHRCEPNSVNSQEIIDLDYLKTDRAALDDALCKGSCKPYEKVFINRRTGASVSALVALARMPGAGLSGIGFAIDLTELKRTEEALEASQETLRLAVERTGLGIYNIDLRSGHHQWSEVAKAQHGLSPDAEVNDGTLRAVVHPDDWEQVERAIREASHHEDAATFELQYRTVADREGRSRRIASRGRIFFQDGAAIRIIGACIDITSILEAQEKLQEEIESRLRAVEELRRQEQLLLRQGRLAAMGEMIANIAHQWRQPLNNLGLMLQELRMLHDRSLLDFEHLNDSVVKGMQIINYMSKTIDGFRNFFAPDKAKEPFNIAETISRTVALLEAGLSKLKLSIELELAQEVEVYGYPNEFSQVILNILVNAKDTIVERGISEPRVAIKAFAVDGKAVVTVTDNAGGITVEPMEKIFDPYFTTKGPDKGTGIGLFMSKMIIEQNMNGRLTVRNTAEGAEFTIEMSRVGGQEGNSG